MKIGIYVSSELFERHPSPWRAEPEATAPGEWIVLDAHGRTVARSVCHLAADALVQLARGSS